ncbi:hypothetical protein KFK09_016801 [Dendrobium nobile]|uniref:DUF4283 domain-containing protein n=1 Tax=Dendrobium nobile TaxID=94219 RepID=A0A8T3AZ63_DENNO|nr:hypothetical protein KFK09_016801 [Dendrobium nobile]
MALSTSEYPPLKSSSLLGVPSASKPPSTSYAENLVAPPPCREDWPLTFVHPEKKLSFRNNDLSEGKSLWNLSLVGYSLGPRPYYERLRVAIEKAWKLKGSLSLLSLADDFFLLKFTAIEDYDMVWSGGPWFLLGRPFILQKWNPRFQPKRDETAAIPIWIKILNLPLALWTPAGISKIASFIGIPLYVDTLTAKRTRLTFARICVKVDKDSVLAEEIPIDLDGEDITLKVVYDWKPVRCEGCGLLIHSFAICPTNPTPKPSLPPKPVFRGRSKSRNPNFRAERNLSQATSKAPHITPAPVLTPMETPSSVENIPLKSHVLIPSTLVQVPVESSANVLIVDPVETAANVAIATDLVQVIDHDKDSGLPNLNLPQTESSSADFSMVNSRLLPPQVLLANNFGSLQNDNLGNPDDNTLEEDLSSTSKTDDINTPHSSNHKATSSSSKKSTPDKASPPKKGKTKTAKKAKSHK